MATIHFPPRANAALLPGTTTAATSPTRAGGRTDALAGAGANDDHDIPGPRKSVDSADVHSPLLEMTAVDPRADEQHYDIRGTALGSSANDVIVHMRDDHIELRIDVPDPRLLEGLDSHMFTHLMNMLGIADIAHLSQVSHATHTLTLRLEVVQTQQQRWTQVQQKWATNHEEPIAALQAELSALRRAAFCSARRWEVPAYLALLGAAIFAVGLWAGGEAGSAPADTFEQYRAANITCITLGVAFVIFCCCCYINSCDAAQSDRVDYETDQKHVAQRTQHAEAKFNRYKQASLRNMRQEPMPGRFNVPVRFHVPDPESMLADAVPGSDASSSSSSSSSSSGATSSLSEPARPPPLSREQQRENMALIVSRHQIWQVLTQAGYEIRFNPDVAYPYDRSQPTASTDPQINALFSDEDALTKIAKELSLHLDVPEPSSDPSPAGERQGLLEPEPEQPSPSVASTTSGPSSSSISSAGAGSGWSARTDLEDRRKRIVELLQRRGFPVEYEVGRAYPGDGTRVAPLDAESLSYGELFLDKPFIAMVRTLLTQAGAQRQPAAVRTADGEVKFHLPEDDKSWEQLKPRDPDDLN